MTEDAAYISLAQAQQRQRRRTNVQDGDRTETTTEDRLALAFAEHYKDRLRFVALWNKWLRWSGHHWQIDATRHAYDLVRRWCRQSAKDQPRAVTAKLVNAVHAFSQADQRLAADDKVWDANPTVLNTAPRDEM